MQHAWNGRPEEGEALAARLRGWGLAASMRELGFSTAPADVSEWETYLLSTKTMKAALAAEGQDAEKRLRDSMAAIFG